MRRFLFALAASALLAAPGFAHFVFVVPDSTGAKATVILSDSLEPDENVTTDKIAGIKLTARDAAGTDTPVTHKADKHALHADLPGTGPRVVFGSIPYGVMQRGETPAYLLVYHPKALVGAVPADKAVVGDKLPAELVPVAAGSELRFRFVAGGKPVADAEVTVVKPDGTSAKVKTDADGRTTGFPATGRYGAWAKTTEAKGGEHGGKKYVEARHYATLVVDAAAK